MSIDKKFLNTEETAEYIGCAPSTLEKARVEGDGIPFTKFGRRVMYERGDIDNFMKANRVSSTSHHGFFDE